MTALFELILPSEEPLGLVGPWQASAAPPLSFGVEETVDVPVWRVNLPADETLAWQAVAMAQAQLTLSEEALARLPTRLDSLVSASVTQGALSFGASEHGLPETGAEATLFDLLDQARALEQGRAVSFGVGEMASEAWEQARAQFDAFVRQLQQEILHLAWVETKIAGELHARSVMGWSGDAETVWQVDVSAVHRDFHLQTLRLAVQSRLLRLRMFTTVTSGAARLSLLLASPLGAWLALPAAWKYVTEILNQIKTYQTLTHGG